MSSDELSQDDSPAHGVTFPLYKQNLNARFKIILEVTSNGTSMISPDPHSGAINRFSTKSAKQVTRTTVLQWQRIHDKPSH